MSSKKTGNLGLHAWEKTDAFMMDEFNENFGAIDKAVAEKADKTALDAETAARETALDAETAARKAALDAETAARKAALDAGNAALAALTSRVGTLETGRVICATGSYTGNGGSTTQVQLPFKPTLLIIFNSAYPTIGGFPWIYGQTAGISFIDASRVAYVNITWANQVVRFTNRSGNDADFRLNTQGSQYTYFILGIKE